MKREARLSHCGDPPLADRTAADRTGVVVIDKPQGPTSHDVVAMLRRRLRVRRIGHAGTLDPMATGVLVAAIGEATKLLPWLTSEDKAYEATIQLGVATDSLDAMGTPTETAELSTWLLEELAELAELAERGERGVGNAPRRIGAALEAERTRTFQVPPAISAVRVGGQRAYALARRGSPPTLPPRPVLMHSIVATGGLKPCPHLAVKIEVGKGYYVRSLARDLALALGTVAHVTKLRRSRSGTFCEAEARTIEAETLEEHIISLPDAARRALPEARLTEAGARAALFGQPIERGEIAFDQAGTCAFFDPAGSLVAVGAVDEQGTGRVVRGFLR